MNLDRVILIDNTSDRVSRRCFLLAVRISLISPFVAEAISLAVVSPIPEDAPVIKIIFLLSVRKLWSHTAL